MRPPCPCGRPARAKGLCSAHYKKAQREARTNWTNRRSASSPVPDTRTPKNGASDQHFVNTFSDLTQNHKYRIEDGCIFDEDGNFQRVEIVCPDCRGEIVHQSAQVCVRSKPNIGHTWCHSPDHPIFDPSGRLIQMTPEGRT